MKTTELQEEAMTSSEGPSSTTQSISSMKDNVGARIRKCCDRTFERLDKTHFPVGHVLAFSSSMIMSFLSFIVVLIQSADSYVIAASRNLLTFLLSLPMLFVMGVSPWPKENKKLILTRAMCSTTAILLNYYALKNMPIGDCQMIYATSPVMVTIFAWAILKEPISANSMVSIMTAIPGLILIIQPPQLFPKDENIEGSVVYKNATYAALMCSLAVVFVGAATICSRKLRNVNCLILTVWNGAFGSIPGFVISWYVGSIAMPSTIDFLCILTIGCMAMIGQNMFICAVKFEAAGVVSLIRKSSDSFIAVLIQILYFQQYPNTYTIIGEVMIFFAVIYSSGYKIAKTSNNLWVRFFFLAGKPKHIAIPCLSMEIGP